MESHLSKGEEKASQRRSVVYPVDCWRTVVRLQDFGPDGSRGGLSQERTPDSGGNQLILFNF